MPFLSIEQGLESSEGKLKGLTSCSKLGRLCQAALLTVIRACYAFPQRANREDDMRLDGLSCWPGRYLQSIHPGPGYPLQQQPVETDEDLSGMVHHSTYVVEYGKSQPLRPGVAVLLVQSYCLHQHQ